MVTQSATAVPGTIDYPEVRDTEAVVVDTEFGLLTAPADAEGAEGARLPKLIRVVADTLVRPFLLRVK